ncbi:MAG: hypothetical protein WB681_05760 [Candidatus Cybelea sp.]
MTIAILAIRPGSRPGQHCVDIKLEGRPYRDILAIERASGAISIVEARSRRHARGVRIPIYEFTGAERGAIAMTVASHLRDSRGGDAA